MVVPNREILGIDLRESRACRNEVCIEAAPLKPGQVQREEICKVTTLPSSRGVFTSYGRVSPVAQGEGGCDRGGRRRSAQPAVQPAAWPALSRHLLDEQL